MRTTFGFEAEFQQNASAVIAGLYDLGLAGANMLHSYHCDCDSCCWENGFPFRGQTDSSCSGEIISDIFTVGDDAVRWMEHLSNVAVQVDAEPGLNSGFHVHVGLDPVVDWSDDEGLDSESVLGGVLWQVIRWEHVLTRIAGGRWGERRDGMNTTVRDGCLHTWHRNGGSTRFTAGSIAEFEEHASEAELGTMQRALLQQQRANDRHSNLNISARNQPTWEFRLWNSTRSAWRMEMFCLLSVAFMDPEVITGLADLRPPQRLSLPATGISDIALACANAGHDRVAELLERQATYLNNRASDAPMSLTVI